MGSDWSYRQPQEEQEQGMSSSPDDDLKGQISLSNLKVEEGSRSSAAG